MDRGMLVLAVIAILLFMGMLTARENTELRQELQAYEAAE